VRDMSPETKIGFGLEDEVMRVLRKATKWTPGVQNGSNVSSIKRQPVTFVVADPE
jgi:periplasmic protein TonB